MGKGKKERIIPIANNALNYLKVYIYNYREYLIKNNNDYVFLNKNGEKILIKSLNLVRILTVYY